MANRNNKTTTVSESVSKPLNETELKSSVQVMGNALRGVYGDGEWDGGVGGTGYWVKYAMFWDAKLVFDGTGAHTITFPFTVADSIVRVTSTITLVTTNYYIASGTSLALTLSGKSIIEINFAKNAKD